MKLINNCIPVSILMDAAYGDMRGYRQLLRAVNDLRHDFAMMFPCYWWSDVPVSVRTDLCYDRADIADQGPDVRYRGIFLNDKERLVDWSVVHFPEDKAGNGRKMRGFNESIYRHFFEVILRLGGNVLWPAMHEGTTAFNFNTDEHGRQRTGEP